MTAWFSTRLLEPELLGNWFVLKVEVVALLVSSLV